jgi:serine/threonine-protein kinase PknG
VPAGGTIGSVHATEDGVRDALEKSYRLLARDTQQLAERVELVNRANSVRVWSLT